MGRRGARAGFGLAVAALLLNGCAGGSSAPPVTPAPTSAVPSATSTSTAPETAQPGTATRTQVLAWVDGDTVRTRAGVVRLIGIDTPERGQCGFGPATSLAKRLAPAGTTVTLVAVPGRDDADRYDRLLRYVRVGGQDVGLLLVRSGYAIARYDSRDGYGGHPLEQAYIDADAATPRPGCRTASPAAAPAPLLSPPPTRPTVAAAAEPWNRPGPDLDCADIRQRVRITGPDDLSWWHAPLGQAPPCEQARAEFELLTGRAPINTVCPK